MHQFNLFPEIFVRDRQALCSSLAGAARLLRVSRHVVYRLRRRFGFLTEAAA